MVILYEMYSGIAVIVTLQTVYLIVGYTCGFNIWGTCMEASVHLRSWLGHDGDRRCRHTAFLGDGEVRAPTSLRL
jgi:hypothetical protein